MAKASTKATTAVLHTKAQLLNSQKYSGRKDILNALLDDKKKYTTDEVDTIINKFMKGKVK